MKKAVPGFLLLLITFAGNAQPVSFSAEVDTNRILIGEQITLTLQGKLPENSDFTWPILVDTISGLEIVRIEKTDTTVRKGNWTILQKIRLTSFDSGYAAIPPLTLSADGQNLIVPAIAIEVAMPELSAEEDMYDIKEPLLPEFEWLPILLWTLGLILFALLVIFLVKWLSKRKKGEKLTPELRLSPYEYARLQLRELEKEQLWQVGKVKEYYSRLTDVLRLYLERQMHINAMESTAEEVIEKVHSIGLPSDLNQKTTELMRVSAMVKYAKEKASTSQNEHSLATVKEFLERTKPVEENDGVGVENRK